MEFDYNYFLTRIYNLFFITFLLSKNSLFYLYYKDSLKFIKDLTFDLERFNYTYIKILQSISCNSLLFNSSQKEFLLQYTNQVPYNKLNLDNDLLIELENNFNGDLKILKDKPINSGIVALVYQAYFWTTDLNSNKIENKIVIKVLKSDVTDLLNSALFDLDFFTKFFDYLPVLNNLNINKLVKFNKESIINQLDFTKEMDNINLWTNYANKVDYLVVPKVFEEFTNYNRNILALEFIESKPLSEISSDDKYQYCKNLIRTVFIGTFFYGIIHGDLHPGNVLFLENFTIGLIDFGIANKISKEEQEAMYKFYKIALIQKNVKDASLTIKNLVYPEENLNNLSEEESLSFYEGVQEVIEKYFVNDPNLIKFIISLSFVVNKYNLTLSKGFSTTIYGISAGINLNLELMQPKTHNPESEYNDLCISIIKELVNEIDFSLD